MVSSRIVHQFCRNDGIAPRATSALVNVPERSKILRVETFTLSSFISKDEDRDSTSNLIE
ncbi:hypothetical protein TorRG33x02_343130 [Trema orientale]|uniref:Uncharacterized protein n=1 Tax=Trema orientale TaxID=63057 RepID=A0A2P5ARV0_TREOI|nr:hypothetical protein TorRG33x02_343130 [Trema orientale]